MANNFLDDYMKKFMGGAGSSSSEEDEDDDEGHDSDSSSSSRGSGHDSDDSKSSSDMKKKKKKKHKGDDDDLASLMSSHVNRESEKKSKTRSKANNERKAKGQDKNGETASEKKRRLEQEQKSQAEDQLCEELMKHYYVPNHAWTEVSEDENENDDSDIDLPKKKQTPVKGKKQSKEIFDFDSIENYEDEDSGKSDSECSVNMNEDGVFSEESDTEDDRRRLTNLHISDDLIASRNMDEGRDDDDGDDDDNFKFGNYTNQHKMFNTIDNRYSMKEKRVYARTINNYEFDTQQDGKISSQRAGANPNEKKSGDVIKLINPQFKMRQDIVKRAFRGNKIVDASPYNRLKRGGTNKGLYKTAVIPEEQLYEIKEEIDFYSEYNYVPGVDPCYICKFFGQLNRRNSDECTSALDRLLEKYHEAEGHMKGQELRTSIVNYWNTQFVREFFELNIINAPVINEAHVRYHFEDSTSCDESRVNIKRLKNRLKCLGKQMDTIEIGGLFQKEFQDSTETGKSYLSNESRKAWSESTKLEMQLIDKIEALKAASDYQQMCKKLYRGANANRLKVPAMNVNLKAQLTDIGLLAMSKTSKAQKNTGH